MSTYTSWVADGKPVHYARPISDLSATLRRHGYTVGTIGNSAHLRSAPPEDHTPYSATGWPLATPYPFVHALDVMTPPVGSGLPSLAVLGAQISADRNAGLAAIGWLKYMNWTPAGAGCRHESWQPTRTIRPSTDVGHIHLSARTDLTHSDVGADYDPVARALGAATPIPPSVGMPAWPGRLLRYRPNATLMQGSDVSTWQQRMRARGWRLDADGVYGPRSDEVCRAFQAEKGLTADGVVGPKTWIAAWSAPVTR